MNDVFFPAASTRCTVCPRHCALADGEIGFCRARAATGGEVRSISYGRLSALALDPIEKKPLARFHPGSSVLSVGSFGCNLRCGFCQNHHISQYGPPPSDDDCIKLPPKALAQKAAELCPQGNIGLAFTYNEPAIGWEYVCDAAAAAKALGLECVMVTNGCFSPDILDLLLGDDSLSSAELDAWPKEVQFALTRKIDAFNIDLKCFSAQGYAALGGGLEAVKQNIATVAASTAHLEVTWLAVPGFSDSEADMEQAAAWLAGLSPDIPLHISRYFPCWQATAPPTPPDILAALAAVARRHLRHVYLGNQ